MLRSRGARLYGHKTTAMHEIEYISPIEYTPSPPHTHKNKHTCQRKFNATKSCRFPSLAAKKYFGETPVCLCGKNYFGAGSQYDEAQKKEEPKVRLLALKPSTTYSTSKERRLHNYDTILYTILRPATPITLSLIPGYPGTKLRVRKKTTVCTQSEEYLRSPGVYMPRAGGGRGGGGGGHR